MNELVWMEVPVWLTNVITVLLGLIVGSFVNVVVARLPEGKSVVRPRSHCPGCEALIPWYDNIPVLSYLLLRGRCRRCRAAISIRYPVIELVTALLFLAVRIRFGWTWVLFVRDWPLVAGLVAVTFIDLEHRIIPDELSLGGLALGILTAWFDPNLGILLSLSGAALGFGLFYGLSWTYHRMTGRFGLGGGDVKLLAMLGSFVGPLGVFWTVFISSVFGSVVGIGWGLLTRRRNVMRVSIPYGPFLVVGGLYYYLIQMG